MAPAAVALAFDHARRALGARRAAGEEAPAIEPTEETGEPEADEAAETGVKAPEAIEPAEIESQAVDSSSVESQPVSSHGTRQECLISGRTAITCTGAAPVSGVFHAVRAVGARIRLGSCLVFPS